MPKIIYLNGPSSSGKTTLAKMLQVSFAEPYLHIGIDKIIAFMPASLNNWIGGTAEEGFSWEPATDPTGQPTFQIHAGPFAKRIIRSLKDISVLLASQEFNLIIDDVSFGAVQVNEWKETLKQFQVVYVGVTTPLDVLEEREHARGDRMLGSARGQYFQVHENVSYDLEVDTHTLSAEENLQQIRKMMETKFGISE